MKKLVRYPHHVASSLLVLLCSVMIGCAASEESAEPPPESAPPSTSPFQQNVAEISKSQTPILVLENDSLKLAITRLLNDNQVANARIGELQSEVSNLKEKLAAIPAITPQTIAPAPAQIHQTPNPVNGDRGDGYQAGIQLFRSRKYVDAASTLQKVIDQGTSTDLQDNCYYWIGECAYAMREYSEAITNFQRVLAFNVSEKKDDSQIMIANSYFMIGNKAKAKEEYERFLEKFPASPFAKRAKTRLGKL